MFEQSILVWWVHTEACNAFFTLFAQLIFKEGSYFLFSKGNKERMRVQIFFNSLIDVSRKNVLRFFHTCPRGVLRRILSPTHPFFFNFTCPLEILSSFRHLVDRPDPGRCTESVLKDVWWCRDIFKGKSPFFCKVSCIFIPFLWIEP